MSYIGKSRHVIIFNYTMKDFKDLRIAVAGTGYVGLSIATLLSQHHHVSAVDVIQEKVEMHAWKMTAGRFDIGSLDTYKEACERFGK